MQPGDNVSAVGLEIVTCLKWRDAQCEMCGGEVGMWKRTIEISKACNQEPLLNVCDWVITVCLDWRNARCVVAAVGCLVGIGWREK